MKSDHKPRLVLIEGNKYNVYEGRVCLAEYELAPETIQNTNHLKQEVEAIRIAEYRLKG